jgi:ATP-dependent DNA ligase
MFKAFEFCLPTNAAKVPAGPEWFHEIKYDGFRMRVDRDGERVRLITRGRANVRCWWKRTLSSLTEKTAYDQKRL